MKNIFIILFIIFVLFSCGTKYYYKIEIKNNLDVTVKTYSRVDYYSYDKYRYLLYIRSYKDNFEEYYKLPYEYTLKITVVYYKDE